MKKTVLSLVVAGSLLVTSPLTSLAQHDGSQTMFKVSENRYVVSLASNGNNWNELIQQILNNYYQQTQPVQQPEQSKQEAEAKPVQPVEQPKQAEKPITGQQSKQPAQQQPVLTSKQQAAYSISQYEKQVVFLTNNERARYGLQPLKIDEKLSEVARFKSSDMQQKGYFSHTSPTYGSPFDMMRQFGVQYRAAGENIAMGQRSPEEVVNAWMNSEGHRKNILSQSFTHIGVGHVKGNYWTQMFIGK
jgi:uncharacterized YkwD family protein